MADRSFVIQREDNGQPVAEGEEHEDGTVHARPPGDTSEGGVFPSIEDCRSFCATLAGTSVVVVYDDEG